MMTNAERISRMAEALGVEPGVQRHFLENLPMREMVGGYRYWPRTGLPPFVLRKRVAHEIEAK